MHQPITKHFILFEIRKIYSIKKMPRDKYFVKSKEKFLLKAFSQYFFIKFYKVKDVGRHWHKNFCSKFRFLQDATFKHAHKHYFSLPRSWNCHMLIRLFLMNSISPSSNIALWKCFLIQQFLSLVPHMWTSFIFPIKTTTFSFIIFWSSDINN